MRIEFEVASESEVGDGLSLTACPVYRRRVNELTGVGLFTTRASLDTDDRSHSKTSRTR